MRPDIARYARMHRPPLSSSGAPDPASAMRPGRLALSRRAFLEASAAGAAFVFSFHLGGEAVAQETTAPKEKKPPNPFDVWL